MMLDCAVMFANIISPAEVSAQPGTRANVGCENMDVFSTLPAHCWLGNAS